MDVLDQLHGAHWADASERLRLVNLAADEIERLRQRVELLEGHLNGALLLIERWTPADTTDARKALEGK
jgi:hypothetical protein